MHSPARWDPASLRLIAITDSLRDGIEGLTSRAHRAVLGGATMIQLRFLDESPRTLVAIARAMRAAMPQVPLIVHARADVAMAAGAQGVHLAMDDISPTALRRAFPPGLIIGVSVGDDTEVASCAGADYVGIGPVFGSSGATGFGTAIGVPRFTDLVRQCGLPAVAIGGVTVENARAVMQAGAAGIAVISALFASPDPTQAGRALRAAQDATES